MKLGLSIGFIFGIVAAFLSTLGLISLTVEMLSPFLFPIAHFIRTLKLNFPAMFIIAILLNALLFAGIGYLIQKYTKKKTTVVYIFSATIAVVIIAVIIEALTKGLSP